MIEVRKSLVREHIDRCIELYGMPCDVDYAKRKVDRTELEQMRADLMLLVGIAAALEGGSPPKPL